MDYRRLKEDVKAGRISPDVILHQIMEGEIKVSDRIHDWLSHPETMDRYCAARTKLEAEEVIKIQVIVAPENVISVPMIKAKKKAAKVVRKLSSRKRRV